MSTLYNDLAPQQQAAIQALYTQEQNCGQALLTFLRS